MGDPRSAEPEPEEPRPAVAPPWLDDSHFWILAGSPFSHVDAMCPVTLRFRDARREADFASRAHAARHHSVDRVFALVNLVSSVLHLFLQLLGWVATDWRALLTSVPFIAISCLHYVAIQLLPGYAPGHHRAAVLIPFRVLYALLIVNTLKFLVPASGGHASTAVIIRHIFLGSGSALGLWLALGMPMLFWQGALLSMGQAAATMYATSGTVCANLERLPHGTELANHIWGALNAASQLCYEAYLPGSSRLTATRTPSCPSVILFTQLLFGALLPLATTYCSEATARLRFLRERDPAARNRAQWAPGGYAGTLVATSRTLLLAACSVLSAASLWEVCNTASMLLAARACRLGAGTCPVVHLGAATAGHTAL